MLQKLLSLDLFKIFFPSINTNDLLYKQSEIGNVTFQFNFDKTLLYSVLFFYKDEIEYISVSTKAVDDSFSLDHINCTMGQLNKVIHLY